MVYSQANAAYFKGLWKSRFLPAKSKKETFFISSTEKSLVTMMRQKGTFNHCEYSEPVLNIIAWFGFIKYFLMFIDKKK